MREIALMDPGRQTTSFLFGSKRVRDLTVKDMLMKKLSAFAFAAMLGLVIIGTSMGSQSATIPTLQSIQRIYVEKMPNDLDQYIRAEITKKFKGKILVVIKPEDADAMLVGTGEHKTGTGAAVTGRWLGLHDTATGAISLLDKEGKVVLWSSEAGDRSIWWGAMKRGGPRKVADRLVNNLKKAMNK